jgi:hypothetical protein
MGEETKLFRTSDIMKAVVRRLDPLTPMIVPNSLEKPSAKKKIGRTNRKMRRIVRQARSSLERASGDEKS